MAGRRRRALSNSTVATVDEAAIQFYQEDSILKSAPIKAHTDDWPCFLLTNATIYHRNGTLANLLHVDLEGPFIVRGRLEIEKDQERYLINRHMRDRSPWIQIQNTLSFSIGLKDDGLPMPVLWASGGAGWFEIVPSEAYKATCDNMFQGISLHYAILDEYEAALEKLHKKKKNRQKTLLDVSLPLDHVLFKYALTVGDGITLPEALKRTKDQAIFLLSHFPKGTHFYNWLKNEFPDLTQKLAAKESNDSKTAPISKSCPLVAVPYSSIEKSSSLEISDSRKGRASLRNSASRIIRNSDVARPEAVASPREEQSREDRQAKTKGKSPMNVQSKSAYSPDTMKLDVPEKRRSLNAVSLRGGRNSLRTSIETRTPQQIPKAAGALTATTHSDAIFPISSIVEILEDSRQEMLELMSEGKQKKHPDAINPRSWCTKLYLGLSIRNPKALAEVCEYYARDLIQLLRPEWHSSVFYKWLEDNIDTTPNFEFIAEEEMKTIVRRKKKQKSSHEEAGSSTGAKEATPRTGGKQPPSRGRPGGKVAGLRPFTGSKKRLRQDANIENDEMDLDEDETLRKTSKRSRYFTDDENDEEAQDTSSSLSDGENAENKDLPLTRVVIRAEKLPSTTPKGPNQTWTCEEPDCGYIVRAADEEEGQALISQHFEAHEKDAQEATERSESSRAGLMNIAVQESQKGHVPINHLLEKIRNFGDKTQKQEEMQLNGQVLPQPIKRSLLV
ncbi:hypothetical protein F4677DRAFT_423518 [Hypoxylon crocopeplum]|nr:hypothetical protein F4677DRAFT_423518 [Hypoxylon crocopeplum]